MEKVRQIAGYHDAGVNFAQFNPADKGDTFATGSDDCKVKIWNFTEGTLIKELSDVHDQPVYALSYDQEGKFLISGGLDKRIILWDTNSGKHSKSKMRHNFSVESIVFSPDNTYFVSTSRDLSWKLWNFNNGKPKERYKIPNAHFSYIMSAAFSNDGSKLVTSSFDRELRVWQVENGERLQIFEGKKDESKKKKVAGSHEKSIARVAWSKQSFIASIDVGGLVKIWSPEGEELNAFEAHTGGNHVEYSFDGSKLLTSGEDGFVYVWNTEDFSKSMTFSVDGLNIKSAHFNSDASRIVFGDESGRIFTAEL